MQSGSHFQGKTIVPEMAADFDFEAIAQTFGVKEELIELLFTSLPYRDVFDQIISLPTAEDLWDVIDSLPRRLSMRLHYCQMKIETTTKDFPAETLSPILESFWVANLQSQGISPTTVNAQAITQVYPEHVLHFMQDIEAWVPIGDDQFRVGDFDFSMDSLVAMCDTFVSNGRTWLFCDIAELRIGYFIFAEQIRALPDHFAYLKARILTKLRVFGYSSSQQMQDDAREAVEVDVPEFIIAPEVTDALSALVKKSKTVFKLELKAPEIGPINDWIRTRSEALVRQMSLPLQQRSAFVLTPQVLQARLGQNPDAPMEPFSIAELLFSNSNGEAAPMPFSSCSVELPVASPIAYCRSVFRRFVARRLLVFGYESASDPVLDVLADVIQNEIRQIGQAAAVIKSGTAAPEENCLAQALEASGYDRLDC